MAQHGHQWAGVKPMRRMTTLMAIVALLGACTAMRRAPQCRGPFVPINTSEVAKRHG